MSFPTKSNYPPKPALKYPIQLLGGRIIHIIDIERSGEFVCCRADDEYNSQCVVHASDANITNIVSKITADFYAKRAASEAVKSLYQQLIEKQ